MTSSPDSLRDGMRLLVEEQHMLTGLCVCYGTAHAKARETMGLAREVLRRGDHFRYAPVPLTTNSLYDLASLTKAFTAVAVLQLVGEGKLRFEDRIGELDPRFSVLKHCSLLDALSYQAVLRTPERVDSQPDADRARDMLFRCAQSSGEEPEKLYSDMNALVLGFVVEAVSGLNLFDYLQKNILEPCAMKNTFARVPEGRLKDCLNYNYEHRLLNGTSVLLDNCPPGLPHDPKARLLGRHGQQLCGHAGLFASAGDMVRFAQALLQGILLPRELLLMLGKNLTGRLSPRYRQYMGMLVYAKSDVQSLSEVPAWMGNRAFGISGYTGNHFALDPEQGVFDVFLGNRCHNRLTAVRPESDISGLGLNERECGSVRWTDGRQVTSSLHYYRQKDSLLHASVHKEMIRRGWLAGAPEGSMNAI